MKTKNKRELEKHWANEAAKKAKPAGNKTITPRGAVNRAARIIKPATGK